VSSLIAGPVRPVSVPDADTALARKSSNALAKFAASDNHAVTLHLENSHTGQQLDATIPAEAVRVLAEVLAKMADGDPVTLVPLQAELSTQQAADLFNVSRPYFIKLLEQGKMPFRKVGEQRRVRYQDLLAYMAESTRAANAALEEMTADAERMGLYT